MTSRPLAIDLFSGLHGWAEGLIAAGFRVTGFDIEDMSVKCGVDKPQHFELVLQDVLTLHGSQFRDAALIAASPPCQEYSYRAMPWKRAKALPPPSNELFDACFRIQREASEAAGHHIPMVVENVCGAQKWVGRAAWHYGSYYLWGDVPALMPWPSSGQKNTGGSWFGQRDGTALERNDPRDMRRSEAGEWLKNSKRYMNGDGLKFGGGWWHDSTNTLIRKAGSRSQARKQASALIAKIPLALAEHIGRVYYPGVFERELAEVNC